MCSSKGKDKEEEYNPVKIVEKKVKDVGKGVEEGLDHNLGQVHEGLSHNLGQVNEGLLDPVGKVITTTLSEGPVEAYQGSDIDTTLETVQEVGQFLWDTGDSIVSGEAKGKTKDFVEGVSAPLGEVADTYQDLGSDIMDTWQNILAIPGQSMDNVISLANSFSKNLQTNLKRQGMFAGTSDFDQSMEDPTLAGRRKRGKRRGNEKDVRSGALKIPTSSTGIQIPS